MARHPARVSCCVAFAVVTASARLSAENRELMPLAEMTKRMEASQTPQYTISNLRKLTGVKADEFAALLYPPMVKAITYAQVETVDGQRRLVAAPCDSAREKLAEAEKQFAQKMYAAAGALYREATVLAPRCYIAEAYLGDAYLFGGDAQLAIAHYDKAFALNPDDPSVRLFRSNAFRHLRQGRHMIDELRWAMALKPRNPMVVRIFKTRSERIPVRLQDVSVAPRGFVRLEKTGVGIYVDEDQLAWLGYALCKGFWLGDPEHRREMTGRSEKTFSLVEERECLLALLTSYAATSKTKADESLDRLKRIVADGLGDAWLIYEFGSLVDPQIVLRMPPPVQQQVHDLVAKYVLVDAQQE